MSKEHNRVASMVAAGIYRLKVTEPGVRAEGIRYEILEGSNRALGDVSLMVRVLAKSGELMGRKLHAEVFLPGNAYGDGWTPHRPAAGAFVRDLALLGTS